jgi:hypothetical protein
MAVEIDEKWLKDQGIEATGDEAVDLIDLAMDELELRVGYEIANQLTDEQIADFEKISDEDKRIDWLDNALPTYPEIVEEKADALAEEVRSSKDGAKLIRSWASRS